MARALAPFLREELDLEGRGHTNDWMTHRDTPSPRLTMVACRSGKIQGAKKLGRNWVFLKESWRSFLEAQAAPPEKSQAIHSVTTVNSGDDELMAEVRSELGLIPRNLATKTFRRV